MKIDKTFLCGVLFLLVSALPLNVQSQSVSNIEKTFQQFLESPELKYASVGFQVVNLNNSSVVFSSDAQKGMVPASTQKIITSATAFSLLGKDFTYQTKIGYSGEIVDSVLYGNIYLQGNGDPTLGSGRYPMTASDEVIKIFVKAIQQGGINDIKGMVKWVDTWTGNVIPNGWIYEDLGSYYGAGASSLNWMENKFDVYLQSGSKIGDLVTINKFYPAFIPGMQLTSNVRSAAVGTGDNAYLFFPMASANGNIEGTIPINEKNFKISASIPNPGNLLATYLEAALKKQNPETLSVDDRKVNQVPENMTWIFSLSSPSLTEISYWFLNKSINLYGEALLKTLGATQQNNGATSSGLKTILDFWQKQGIDPNSLKMQDGSGLSPGNRITVENLVKVLQYSKTQNWFNEYFKGFPTINGMKMKSGTLTGTVSYAGIIKNKHGQEFAFAIIVNNFSGTASSMRKKVWQVLDQLK